jgi:3-oxoacyl-[acyl-carrier protein] reductase
MSQIHLNEGEAVEFIQMDLTHDIDLNDIFSHIKQLDCLIYSIS